MNLAYNIYTCLICGKQFYQIYNNLNDNNSYINCYDSPKGFYLDNSELLYKPCYNSCKSCLINGNDSSHNCLECKDDYIYKSILNNPNYKNCYPNILSDIISDIPNDSYLF